MVVDTGHRRTAALHAALMLLAVLSFGCEDHTLPHSDLGAGDAGAVDLPPLPDSVTPGEGTIPTDIGLSEDAALEGCSKCHGSPNDPAPPVSVSGKSATSERGVGAHQAHLKTSTWRAKLQCGHCHQVPTKLLDKGHIDTALPAELTFTGLAKADYAKPSWDGAKCAGSYCHGGTLSGGNNTAPAWTTVDGTQAACGTCHGLPPNKNHTSNKQCSMCHKATVDDKMKIIDASKHINGKVDLAGISACNACHGGAANAAPPRSVKGKTATSEVGVGAHQAHLKTSTWRAKVKCGDCHQVPKNLNDTGHIDSASPAEVVFSALVKTDNAKPSWTGASCSGSYCHGSTLSGGSNTSPKWTTVDGTQAACGTCHGLPPNKNHTSNKQCSMCHKATVDDKMKIIDASKHINGKVDLAGISACNACHGGAANAAPPRSLKGKTSTSERAVGAHQAHLKSSTWRAQIACSACHQVPKNLNDTGHIDSASPAEVSFSALVKTDNAKPWWSGASCSSAYCHGATLSGGSNTTPLWTQVDGTQAACGTCHGLPPNKNHTSNKQCSMCHKATVDDKMKIIDAAKHINGKVDLSGISACNACHGGTANAAPPVSVKGKTSTSDREVGAHQAHLKSSSWRATIACSACHQVPKTYKDTGHVDTSLPAEVTFSGTSRADSAKPYWSGSLCAGSYCHGATLSGGTLTSPTWTKVNGTQAACGTCHSLPPTKNHTTNKQCSMCHKGTVDDKMKIIDAGKHINGKVDIAGISACNACHGDAANAAPPKSLKGQTATSFREVGAHQAHLKSSTWRAKLMCADCHKVPKTLNDTGHIDTAAPAEVSFSSLAKADGGKPYWSGASCSGSYCHGATLSGGTNTAPSWTKVDGTQAKCGTCHSLPPTKNHTSNKLCSMCHKATVNSAGKIIDAGKHINGKVDLAGISACNACHGGAANAAPPKGLNGQTSTTARQVGAHQAHLQSSTWRAKVACSDCHLVPKAYNEKGHIDTSAPAEVTFSTLAKTGGAKPAWDGITCKGSYCHGATLSKGTNTAPTWTKVNNTQDACGTCHGLPPAGHPTNMKCSVCHKDVVDSKMKIINAAKHIDGKLSANGGCTICHAKAQGSRRKIVGTGADFSTTSHHVKGTIKDADCVVCHDVSGHQYGKVQLKDPDGSAKVYSYSSSDPSSVEGFCLGCHDSDGAKGDKTPFSDNVTVPDVKGTGKNLWAGSAHDSIKFSKNGNKPISCLGDGKTTGCHANGHGVNKTKMLAGSASTIDTFCYGCHTDGVIKNHALSNRKGYHSADDIQEAFTKKTKHKIGGTFKVNGQTFTLQCTTCHNPHLVTGKYWSAASNKTPITRPSFTSAAKNPRAVGTNVWGDGPGEKMKDYAGSGLYQAPNNDVFTGAQLPDYVTFCLDCHKNSIGKGPVSWSKSHGKGTAGTPAGGHGPNWYSFGKGLGWDGDNCVDYTVCWPVKQRGKSFLAHTRKPYDQEKRIANANFVLSCVDCHEAHGSARGGLIRERHNTNDQGGCGTGKNGDTCRDGSNWNNFCNSCHYYYTPFHAGMSCGNASCHTANSIHRMGNTGKAGAPYTYNPDLVFWYRFEKNFKDSGTWHMHGKWMYQTTGTFSSGRSGYAVVLNGKSTIQVGTQDFTWSTCEGGPCGAPKGVKAQGGGAWKFTHMKYNTTLEAWVYPTDTTANKYSVFTKHTGVGNGDYALELRRYNGALRLVFICQIDNNGAALGGPAGVRGAYSSVGIPLNAWTHVAATFDTKGPDASAGNLAQGRIRLYINGNDVTWSNTSGGLRQPAKGETSIFAFPENNLFKPSVCYNNTWCAGEFSVGGFHGWQKPFIGRMDDAKVWNVTKPSSYFSSMASTQKPVMSVAVGSGSKVTVVFNEGVYTNKGAKGALVPGDFAYVDKNSSGARTITSVSHAAGSATATLILSAALGSGDLGVDQLAPVASQIFDAHGNASTAAVTITATP